MHISKPGEHLPCPSLRPIMFTNICKSIFYHGYTVYLFIANNIKDIICLGFMFGAINATVAPRLGMGPPVSLEKICRAAPSMLLWSWTNLFIFNLHNQRNSVAEDALNKPWRPLPARRLTSAQATAVMYCMYPVIIITSLSVGGLVPCLTEAFSCLWYNEWGGASDPFLKNLLNGIGFACFFAGPLEVATGHSVCTVEAMTWLSIIAGAITTVSHLQDFRDMTGDAITGRKTMPLAIGDMNARVVVAIGVTGWTLAACLYWSAGAIATVAWIPSLMIAGNLFHDRTTEGDTFTWKLFPYWVVGLSLLPLRA